MYGIQFFCLTHTGFKKVPAILLKFCAVYFNMQHSLKVAVCFKDTDHVQNLFC